MIFSDTDRQAIRELELSGFKVMETPVGLLLVAGHRFPDVPAILRHLLHHGVRLGAAPVCPDCSTGSCVSHGGHDLRDGASSSLLEQNGLDEAPSSALRLVEP